MTNPSNKALVPFVSVDNMMRLIHHIGIEEMLRGLADYIEADFRRWQLFRRSGDADLSIEFIPGKQQGYLSIRIHRHRFVAVVIGEEDETSIITAL